MLRPLGCGLTAVGLCTLAVASATAQTVAPEVILRPADHVSRAATRPLTPPLVLRPAQDIEPDGNEVRPPAPQVDGDLSGEREPDPPRDGFLTETVPATAVETPDGFGQDARHSEDIAALSTPPAGHDPLLFRIEDVMPIADRRIDRLFRIEPYDPIGLRIGSFVLFSEVEIAGVASSNVRASPAARSDRLLTVTPQLRLVSNWSWHGIEVRARGHGTFHDEVTSEDDRDHLIEARGRLDITSRTNLQALAAREVTQESRTGIDAATGTTRADVTTATLAGSLNHRFNRLTVQLRGGVRDVDVSGVRDATGFVGNDERDVRESEEALRLQWEFKPTLNVFGEVVANQRDFAAPGADGIERDSDGTRLRLGIGFGSFGQKLRGEVSVGWGAQRPGDHRLETIDGVLLDANVAYRATPLTTLQARAATDLADTTTPGISGAIQRTYALQARHAFRAWLIGTAEVQTIRYDYIGGGLEEADTTANLGLEYYLAREVVLFGHYQHQWFVTNEAGAGWQADEIRLGVRLRR